jgi:hypothetical protein
VIDSGVDDILLTWRHAIGALEDASDSQQRDELTERVRTLESLYGRRVDAGQVSQQQRETGKELSEETKRVLLAQRAEMRPDEHGEWY